jgi:UDP:flavonoid glycosyltransferase YjiC (YdhE family)
VAPVSTSIADRTQMIRPAFDVWESAVLPAWFDRLDDLETVYVTFGTVYHRTPGLIETIVAGLQGQYNLIVTVSDRDPADFAPHLPTVRIEQYVPQAAILPRCDVVCATVAPEPCSGRWRTASRRW